MAPANSQIGGNRGKVKRKRGEVEERGGGVFLPSAKRMVGRTRRERRRPSLFIGRLGRCPGGEIFSQPCLSTMYAHG